jgi:ATPase family AAA domain-containing protein 3A/B
MLAEKNQDFVKNLFHDAERDRRETQRQNIITAFNMAGSGAQSMLMNPKFLAKASYLLFIGFGAFHLTRLVLALGTGLIMSRFGKPQLVRETSKLHSNNPVTLPLMYLKKQFHQRMRKTEKDLLNGVILEKNLEDQLREISYAVLNRKKHFAPAKNLMFYGPPGTGKTLFAKKLALQSGLEYAVMVGSDIAPLGPLAVRELNKLFDWAEKQNNGIILFIDEADAFLRNRKSSEMSEYMRHTINSFLYRTGSPSDNVIIVMATNAPEQLDEAVHDRIDEIIGFGLPSVNERKTMLFHYLVKYCQPPQTQGEKIAFLWKHPRSIYTGKKLIRMEGITTEIVQEIAEKTEGFSGREITKMVIAWHDAAFTLPEPILTPELMRKVLKKFHLQHELKQTWSKEEAMMMEKMLFIDEAKMQKDIEAKKAEQAAKQADRDPEYVKAQERIT